MTTESSLREAIERRRPVALSYEGGAARLVHPHAIYRTSTGKTCLEGFQLDGPTSSGSTLPGWRPFNLARISSVDVLDGTFDVEPDFDPAGPKYGHGLLAVVRP